MGGLQCDLVTANPECGGATVRPGDCLPRVWGGYGATRGLLTQSGALDELLPLLYPGQAQEERLSLCRASLTLLDLCTEQRCSCNVYS